MNTVPCCIRSASRAAVHGRFPVELNPPPPPPKLHQPQERRNLKLPPPPPPESYINLKSDVRYFTSSFVSVRSLSKRPERGPGPGREVRSRECTRRSSFCPAGGGSKTNRSARPSLDSQPPPYIYVPLFLLLATTHVDTCSSRGRVASGIHVLGHDG